MMDDSQWGADGDSAQDAAPRRAAGSRAEKSLGLLCSRFLELYHATHTPGESHLSLDHAAASLGVEVRSHASVLRKAP